MSQTKSPNLDNKAIALVCVVIFTFVLTIIGASLLSLLANQTRTIEHNIDRLRALYAVESVFVKQIDQLVRDGLDPQFLPDTEDFPWVSGDRTVDIVRIDAGSNTTGFNITLDYDPIF